MTVAGRVIANDLRMDSFNISVSLPIALCPYSPLLTVRATIDRDEFLGNSDMLLPRVSTLVFITGCVMCVERRLAYVSVIDVDTLCLSDDDVHSVL